MKDYFCLIISHGDLASELYNVTQKLLPIDIPVHLYSNKKESIENIVDDADKKIKESNPEKILIFVDLVGGSCWHAAMGLKRIHDNVAIIGGVNIPVLVSFATNMEHLSWSGLLDKLQADAVKAIKVIK